MSLNPPRTRRTGSPSGPAGGSSVKRSTRPGAMGHHAQVARAYGQLEQRAPLAAGGCEDQGPGRDGRGRQDRCPWCLDFGYWVMYGHGISREKIEGVPHWQDRELSGPLERLVLEYAGAMTLTPPTVGDELVKRLRITLMKHNWPGSR